jgi:hypothetical protein
MRTNRRTPLLLIAALAASFATACVDSSDEDPMWDDELGEATSELTVPSGMVGLAPTESSAHLVNPERGFYTGYNLVAAGDATSIRNGGYTLAIALVNLGAYRDSALPSSFLTQLTAGFAKARAAGIKLVVRFTYNTDGGADASKARILAHLTQLKPIISSNADVIAVVQAGLIGRWGEWHGSTNGLDNPTDRGQIIAALLSAVPTTRSIQLRRPNYKNDYRTGALTSSEAWAGSSKSRIGHHNDCFLASSSDLGTYVSPIDSWRTYTAADSAYSPMGGETCAVYTTKTNCTASMAEMALMHWSYLNKAYNASVINGWINEGCESTIRRKLGYRFVMTRVAYTPKVAPGGVLGLELDIANKGYAQLMNSRPVDVVLISGSTRKTARLTFDARRLPAGKTTTIKANLRLPGTLPAGTYTIALRLPDASSKLASDNRYAIQLANNNVWNASTGDNTLTTTFKVDASAGTTMGIAVSTSATTFAQI